MTNLSAAQRKTLARMSVAMPDGSYYIRNGQELDDAIKAVGRAEPSEDQTAEDRRNSVRRHIIKRANILKLSERIPDSWNADGSLKHSDINDEEFIEHHGVKGMHWGHHLQHQLELHQRVASGNSSILDRTVVRSNMTPIDFIRHKGSIESFSKERAAKLQAMKDRAESGNSTARDRVAGVLSISPLDLARSSSNKAKHSDINDEEFIEHHGVKGMHWGVRKDRLSSANNSEDAHRALRTAETINKHGTSAVSNEDLQHLITRLDLVNKHSRLMEKDSNFSRGIDFVKLATGTVKTGLDVVDTGKRVHRTVKEIKR